MNERVAIDSATHEILRYRSIRVDADPGPGVNYYYGLADMTGRQILAPNYMKLEIINRNWAYGKVQMQGDFMIDLRTGAQTRWTWGLNEFTFGDAKLVLVTTSATRGSGANARADLATLGHDGQPLAQFPSVRTTLKIGPFLVLNVVDESRMTQSPRPPGTAIWLDQSGAVVRTSPEVASVYLNGVEHTLIASDARPPLGRALSLQQPFTYRLHDSRGNPVEPPNGIVAVAPIQDPFKLDEAGADWDGWIVIRDSNGVRDVRLARGRLQDAIASFDRAMQVDNAVIVEETVRDTLLSGVRRQLVVHEPGKGWALYPSLGGTIGHYRFANVQDAANLFAVHGNAVLNQIFAETLARQQAEAAADSARRNAGAQAFDQILAGRSSMSGPEFRSRLQTAAFQAGGTYLSRFLTMFPDAAEDPSVRDRACRESAVSCTIAMSSHTESQRRHEDQQRAIFEQRVALTARFTAMSNPDPNVRVNIYENGQFRTEVMPRSHYESLYR